MIAIDRVWAKWAPVFSGDAEPGQLLSRTLLLDAVSDIHDLIKIASAVREYGAARIALGEASVELKKGKASSVRARAQEWSEASDRASRAFDRLAALSVQLAGGDVAGVLDGNWTDPQEEP